MSSADPTIRRFRTILSNRLGLRLQDEPPAALEELLVERVAVPGLAASRRDYLDRLDDGSYGLDELACLARSLTVGETYFLRHAAQLESARAHLVRRARHGQRAFRILSAACSTGEEPYSLAIVALECLPANCDVAITGLDVNDRSIAHARRADYPAWSLRQTPHRIRERYFTSRGRRFVLRSCVRSQVRFAVHNLVDSDATFWGAAHYDIIFLRNVLMYLTPGATRTVVGGCLQALAADGLLFLGEAETLRGVSEDWAIEQSCGAFFYRRADGGTGSVKRPSSRLSEARPGRSVRASCPLSSPAPETTSDAWLERVRAANVRVAELVGASQQRQRRDSSTTSRPSDPVCAPGDRRSMILDRVRRERFDEALALCEVPPAPDEPELPAIRALLLANSGQIQAALRACQQLLDVDPLNAAAHYVQALCREHLDDYAGAMAHDRQAIYLDPDFAMPHLHLGLLCRRRGDRALARRQLRIARALLQTEDDTRLLLFGGGFDREQLMAVCCPEPVAAPVGEP